MQKLLWIVGAAIGSAVGWWLGERFGIMTAFIISSVGMVIGTVAGFKLGRSLME